MKKNKNKISLDSYVSVLRTNLLRNRTDIHYHCDIGESEKFEDYSFDEKEIPSFHIIKEYSEVMSDCQTETSPAIIAVYDYVKYRDFESALKRVIRTKIDIWDICREKISRRHSYYYALMPINCEPRYEEYDKKQIKKLVDEVVAYYKILNSREFSLADERLKNDIELTALGLKEKYGGE